MNYPQLATGLICCLGGVILCIYNNRVPDVLLRLYTFTNDFEAGVTRLPPSRTYLAVCRAMAGLIGAALLAIGIGSAIAAAS